MSCGKLDVGFDPSATLALAKWLLLGFWFWHDKTFSSKRVLDLIPCLLEWKTLLINTLTPYHGGNMMNAWGNVYAMHDKNAFYLQTQEPGRPFFLTHNVLGIMVHSQSLPWCLMHAFKKVMQTFRLPVTKWRDKCNAWATTQYKYTCVRAHVM